MSIKSAYSTLRTDQFEAQRATDAHADAEERTYATFMHLSLLAAAGSFGALALSIPVLMWMYKRKKSPFLDDHGKETINFQISLIIYGLATALVAVLTFGLGVVFFVPLGIYALVFTIVAAMAANRGEYYRYPACLRVLH